MNRSRESVHEVFRRLGGTLLTLKAGKLETDSIVDEVVVQSTGESNVITAGTVVLGVGVKARGTELCSLVRDLGAAHAAALVLRDPVEVDDAVVAAACESRVPLLALLEGVPWMYLADMIRPVRGWREEDSVVTEASLSADLNLFKVANSLAEILDAPVTIEDMRSRVLAFSDNQERADEARKTTVLGQQVPRHIGTTMARLGVFQRLYSSDLPIRIEPLPGGVRGRIAIQIRAGDTPLGSIWAIFEESLSDLQTQAMVLAANTAAATILHGRIAGDAVQRMRTATVTALISGGQPARSVAGKVSRAQLRGGCVLAARIRSLPQSESIAGSMVDCERLASSVVMFLRAECDATVAAVLNDTIYVVMLHTADFRVDSSSTKRLVSSFVDKQTHKASSLLVGIGRTVSDPGDLDRSREDADLVVRVLDMPRRARRIVPQVATREDVYGPSLILRLSDIVADDPIAWGPPLSRLEHYDFKHHSNLVETLEIWLEQFGDVARTADLLYVHKNTLRYRLDRIEEVGGVDLNDPEQRFDLMLQLRVTSPTHSERRDQLQNSQPSFQLGPRSEDGTALPALHHSISGAMTEHPIRGRSRAAQPRGTAGHRNPGEVTI